MGLYVSSRHTLLCTNVESVVVGDSNDESEDCHEISSYCSVMSSHLNHTSCNSHVPWIAMDATSLLFLLFSFKFFCPKTYTYITKLKVEESLSTIEIESHVQFQHGLPN